VGTKEKTARKEEDEEVEDEENSYQTMVESLESRLSAWQLYMDMSLEHKNGIRHCLGLELL